MRLACGVLCIPDKILEQTLLILKPLLLAYLSFEMNSKDFFDSEPDHPGISEINERSL